MKVIRKSDQEFHAEAKKAHARLVADHKDAAKKIEASNAESMAVYEHAVAERKKIQQQMEKAADHMHAEAMEDHKKHVEWWEDQQAEKKRLNQFAKIIMPFRFKLRGGQTQEMMGEPGEPPERLQVPELPSVPKPELTEVPSAPPFEHEDPPTYSVEVVADEITLVKTPWGTATALPGNHILTNDKTGEKHIETDESLKQFFTRAR